jgi:hypothetical protein
MHYFEAVSANQTSKTYPIPISRKASQPWHKQAIFRSVGTLAKSAYQHRHVRPSVKYHRGPPMDGFPRILILGTTKSRRENQNLITIGQKKAGSLHEGVRFIVAGNMP